MVVNHCTIKTHSRFILSGINQDWRYIFRSWISSYDKPLLEPILCFLSNKLDVVKATLVVFYPKTTCTTHVQRNLVTIFKNVNHMGAASNWFHEIYCTWWVYAAMRHLNINKIAALDKNTIVQKYINNTQVAKKYLIWIFWLNDIVPSPLLAFGFELRAFFTPISWLKLININKNLWIN